MTQVIRETNTCPRHGHPAKLLLWGQSHIEEQCVQRLGQQSQRARAPTQAAPVCLDTRPPTSAKQRCYQLTWQATPDRLKESNEEVIDFLTLSWQSRPCLLHQREESPGPFPKNPQRPS